MIINIVKEKDDDKEEAEVRIPAEVAAAIAVATFKVSDIYKNDT